LHDGQQYYFRDVNKLDLDNLPQNKKDVIKRYQKINDMLSDFNQGNREDKFLIRLKSAYNSVSDYNWDRTLDSFKSMFSQYAKVKRSIFKLRGLSEDTDINVVVKGLNDELAKINMEIESVSKPEFQDKLIQEIQDKKEKLAIKGGTLDDRVKEFSKLNYLMSYKINQVDVDECKIPVIELPVQNVITNKSKQIQIAKAKAIAIKIKLKLAKAKLSA